MREKNFQIFISDQKEEQCSCHQHFLPQEERLDREHNIKLFQFTGIFVKKNLEFKVNKQIFIFVKKNLNLKLTFLPSKLSKKT